MHALVSVVFFFLGVILINSAPFEVKLKPRSQEMQESEESAAQHNSPRIPLLISRHFIKARNNGFCLRRLSFSLG